MLLCMLEAVEGGLCSMEVPEVMRNVLLYMLEALEVLEVMRRVLFCMLEIVDVPEMLEALEVMRCMLLRKCSRLWRVQNDEEAI